MRKINIGIIGLGNVGCGVVKILSLRKSLLAQKIETDISDINFSHKINLS
jgi:homoserine dehydrogenase